MRNQAPRELREATPSIYLTLTIKYALIVGYGIWSEIVGVATIGIVAGQGYAVVYPLLIALLAAIAIVGVHRSRRAARRGLEVVSTVLLFAVMAGYILSILIRSGIDGNYAGAPVALLLVALSVSPGARVLGIARSAKGAQ